jgi:hypothetical protein
MKENHKEQVIPWVLMAIFRGYESIAGGIETAWNVWIHAFVNGNKANCDYLYGCRLINKVVRSGCNSLYLRGFEFHLFSPNGTHHQRYTNVVASYYSDCNHYIVHYPTRSIQPKTTNFNGERRLCLPNVSKHQPRSNNSRPPKYQKRRSNLREYSQWLTGTFNLTKPANPRPVQQQTQPAKPRLDPTSKYITQEAISEPLKAWHTEKDKREDNLVQRKKFMVQQARLKFEQKNKKVE